MVMQVSALPPHAVMVQPLHGLIIMAASNPETQRQSCADPPVQAIIAGLLFTACMQFAWLQGGRQAVKYFAD